MHTVVLDNIPNSSVHIAAFAVGGACSRFSACSARPTPHSWIRTHRGRGRQSPPTHTMHTKGESGAMRNVPFAYVLCNPLFRFGMESTSPFSARRERPGARSAPYFGRPNHQAARPYRTRGRNKRIRGRRYGIGAVQIRLLSS